MAPVLSRKSPTNLNTWREMGLKLDGEQPDESCKRNDPGNLHGPEAEAVLVEVPLDSVDQRMALFRLQYCREVFHDSRIRIEGRECGPIRSDPSPKK
jgi:hypothetical protein